MLALRAEEPVPVSEHRPWPAFSGGGERTQTVGLYIANVASTYLDAVLTIPFGQ